MRLTLSAVSGGAILDGLDEDAGYGRAVLEQKDQVSYLLSFSYKVIKQ
jgi:hypothetical protein